MTTHADHLKHRTGSLGGDQDEKAVQELIAENERLVKELAFRDFEQARDSSIAHDYGSYADIQKALGTEITMHAAWRKRAEEAEAALAQKTRECEELRAQRTRIIEAESNRNLRLRSGKAWHPIRSKSRPDCIAQRIGNDGQSELLMYNNVLGDPFYIAHGTIADDNESTLAQLVLENKEHLLRTQQMQEGAIEIIKENDALKAQVEQLGRQVKELSREAAGYRPKEKRKHGN